MRWCAYIHIHTQTLHLFPRWAHEVDMEFSTRPQCDIRLPTFVRDLINDKITLVVFCGINEFELVIKDKICRDKACGTPVTSQLLGCAPSLQKLISF